MALAHANESLEALKYWSKGEFVPSTSNVAGYLMHHCVLEIEFRRKYESRVVIGRRGGIRREYRDRSHRNGYGAPYVADWWYGRKRRVMLCTLDMTLLRSLLGRDVLNYREPAGVGEPMPNNIVQVWDIVWQDFRAVDFTNPVNVRAVIPTSVLPSDKPDGTTQEGRAAISQQQEIFRQILEANFRRMPWRAKFSYMDGDIDLHLQEAERQLRKRVSDKAEEERKAKEEEEAKRVESEIAAKKALDYKAKQDELARMRTELESMEAQTQGDRMRSMIKEMREISRGMPSEEERRFVEELKTFGQSRGLEDLGLE